MSERPALLVVDDDPNVLNAVERDLRRRYSSRYRVIAVGSGAEALDVIDQLVLRDDLLALVVADQRMPQMTGTQLLSEVGERTPTARRVLLTAYADTDAAIAAINEADVDYYILKPWDPPEERLFPITDDLLGDWEAFRRPPTQLNTRVVGDRWSSESHRLREFLSRNQVPFQWLEVGRSDDADRIVTAAGGVGLPLLVLENGEFLSNPTLDDAANALGMNPTLDCDYYDLVIVGAGPAGLAVYGASEGLSTAVVEEEAPGGQAGTSSRIENYLGFPQGVSGADLARRAYDQARRYGATLVAASSTEAEESESKE